jgi:hypothetical protein
MSLGTLPTELIHEISSYLTFKQNTALSWTCRKMHKVLARRRPPRLLEWLKLNEEHNLKIIDFLAFNEAQKSCYKNHRKTFHLKREKEVFHNFDVENDYELCWPTGSCPIRWDRCPSCWEENKPGSYFPLTKVFEQILERTDFLHRRIGRRNRLRFLLTIKDEKVFYEEYQSVYVWAGEATYSVEAPQITVMCDSCRLALVPTRTRVSRGRIDVMWK